MFNPAEALRDNPALFACYILFVYFRGRNAVRIEREMRSLGYSTFHRRNLYPRGSQPGWIGKFGWQSAVSGRQSADGSCRAIETSGRNASVNERGHRADQLRTQFPSLLRRGGRRPGWFSLHRSADIPCGHNIQEPPEHQLDYQYPDARGHRL